MPNQAPETPFRATSLQNQHHEMAKKSLSKTKTAGILAILLLIFACKNDPKKNENAAAEAHSQGNPRLQQLNDFLEKDPKNDSLLYLRAATYQELEGYDQAILDLLEAMKIDSMQPNYYHLLADVFMDYTKSKQAVTTMEVAMSKFPDRTPTLLKMSEFYLVVRRHTEALQTLDKILRRDPQNAEAYFMTGRVALDMGDSKRAIAAFRKAVQLDASIADAHYFLGKIYSQQKDPQALQYFDNALRLDSTNLDYVLEKAVFFKQTGKFKQAFEIYRDLTARDPDFSDAWFDMGIMYLEQDSLPKAFDHFDIAIKTNPLFVKAYFYRGVVSEEMGNLEAALNDYRQANKMSPNFPDAKEALERLKK